MKLYVHAGGAGQVDALTVDPHDLVKVLLGAAEAVWAEDADEPLDPAVTIAAAGLQDRSHVHRGRARRITATVRFNGESKEREFAPSARVERAFKWAVGDTAFDLPRDQRAKHTLFLGGTQVEADRDAHLGSLATDQAVWFELAPKERYTG
jgi:hypothetical protein